MDERLDHMDRWHNAARQGFGEREFVTPIVRPRHSRKDALLHVPKLSKSVCLEIGNRAGARPSDAEAKKGRPVSRAAF